MIGLVNLFARLDSAEHSLTPALMALLEHSDPSILAGFLELAGLKGPSLDGAQFLYPAPEAPPGIGEIRSPHRRFRLAAVPPGFDVQPAQQEGIPLLVINMAGRAPEGLKSISWEQADRWLAAAVERYDAESRTGFLLRQFRAYLPEVGISYFAGFDRDDLAEAPRAIAKLAHFYQQASDLFERVGGELPEGLSQVRQARPEDLLAGYCYRDYVGGRLGAENFLRIALHLGPGELQIACWFGAAGGAHARFRGFLLSGSEPLATLRSVEPQPLLWLWSPAGEERIPLEELEPGRVTGIDWGAYSVALQVNRPFADLAGEGLAQRISAWVSELLDPLGPILTDVVH